jgi:hypothetical protein
MCWLRQSEEANCGERENEKRLEGCRRMPLTHSS